MKTKWRGVFSILVCVIAAVTLTAPGWACSEIFVVSAENNGDANYMVSNGDGTFSSLEILQLTEESEITAKHSTFGNGIGDFNNDGECDYIAGFGYIDGDIYLNGDIYIFEKLGAGNQFAAPVKAATWDEGYYPMDLAVADFNGDGHMDFVMSYFDSTSSGLYLGNGAFGFTYFALENTAPVYSAGVDAADFNNDGLADFVVAPYSGQTIFVNLNNGDGTYTTLLFDTHDGNAVYGIAAADFNNDGVADIATAFDDSLVIYTGNVDVDGNGDGTFQLVDGGIHEFALNQSPIDNYDFDGDGDQDLVAANFSTDNDGVAVFLNNGYGSFIHDDTYLGGTGGYLVALSGPPYKPDSNKEPVAVLDPISFEVTAGEAIEFDGSKSYDEDGEIIGYEWDFGDEIQTVAVSTLQIDKAAGLHTGGDIQTHVYNEAGWYIVTLTVTDDKGATASVEAEVHVAAIPVPEFIVKFTPRRLNLKSRGKWIRATITVLDGYDARQIDRGSVRIVPDEGRRPIFAHTYSKHGFLAKLLKKYGSKRKLSVRFDRQAVIAALDGALGITELKLEGKLEGQVKVLHNGRPADFSGSGTIKVIEKKKGKKVRHEWKSRMKSWRYYWH